MTTIRLKKNLWSGIFSLVLGLVLLFILIPTQVEVSQYIQETVNSRFVPQIIAYLLCIFGLMLVFQSGFQKNDTILEISISTELYVLSYFLILVVYVLLIGYIGFFFSCLFMGITTLAFLKTKKPSYYIATILTFIVTYFVFVWLLKVSLPTVIGQYI